MSNPITTLTDEHRVIEQVLGALEGFAQALDRGEPADRRTVADFAEFFSLFADRCHHGKEEERLFVAMNRAGFPRERGPIAVMLVEHDEGRAHVRALRAVGAGSGPLTADERAEVIAHARAFVPLLRGHILKEDNVLYPMAVNALPGEVLERLGEEFEAFERDGLGAGEHERLRELGRALAAAHSALAPPPAPACCGCSAAE